MIQRTEHQTYLVPNIDLAYTATAALFLARNEAPPDPPEKVSKAEVAETAAYVNHSRWVADCPFCNGAQIVSPADPRYFCNDCRNKAVDGDYARIVFPSKQTITAIEKALDERLVPENRNWLPHETIKQLHAENAHFIPKQAAEMPAAVVMRHGQRLNS